MGLSDVKLVILDVDGVLTDGTISVSDDGVETKHFNVRDWTGIAYLERAGNTFNYLIRRRWFDQVIMSTIT